MCFGTEVENTAQYVRVLTMEPIPSSQYIVIEEIFDGKAKKHNICLNSEFKYYILNIF